MAGSKVHIHVGTVMIAMLTLAFVVGAIAETLYLLIPATVSTGLGIYFERNARRASPAT